MLELLKKLSQTSFLVPSVTDKCFVKGTLQKDRALLLSLNFDLPGNPKRKNRAMSKMCWSAHRVLSWVYFMALIQSRRYFLLEITLEKKA